MKIISLYASNPAQGEAYLDRFEALGQSPIVHLMQTAEPGVRFPAVRTSSGFYQGERSVARLFSALHEPNGSQK